MRTRAVALTAVVAVLLAAGIRAQQCDSCLIVPYWPVDASSSFPETATLGIPGPTSFGIAFSGGGTRSATATTGSLRGLRQNGWLDRVQYLTAVSGGSWASVPFTYSRLPLEELLGEMEAPAAMTDVALARTPQSHILQAVVASRLSVSGAAEALQIAATTNLAGRQVFGFDVNGVLDRVFGTRRSRDQTYADVLGRIFLNDGLVPGGAQQRYSWNDASVTALVNANAPAPFESSDFITVAPKRPFLIVGGSIIYVHPAYDYPRLIPFELTPMYSGVRQRFGGRLGGGYVSPLGYDVEAADFRGDGMLRVVTRTSGRVFTLADVIAVSGAAPLLGVFRGKPFALARRGAEFFPAFNHVTVRESNSRPAVRTLSHGDGGFTDNLGLMPLLARGVRNVIVFDNAKDTFETNTDLQSLFEPLGKRDDWGGDRSGNLVFRSRAWSEVRDGLKGATDAGHAAIYCGRGWTVDSNELYGIRGYGGLNICFVYNYAPQSWRAQLPAETQTALTAQKRYRGFPWYATFGQNAPRVIRLDERQVNLLANLTAWAVTDSWSVDTMCRALGAALGCGPAQ
jgi:hypothetical protein